LLGLAWNEGNTVTDPDLVQERPIEAAPPWLSRIQAWVRLVRDLGVIIGIPIVIVVGLRLYEVQVAADAATIHSLEAENNVLRETQFDHALSLIKSQTDAFSIERQGLMKQISALQKLDTKRVEWMARVLSLRNRHAEALTTWMEKFSKNFYHPTIIDDATKELDKEGDDYKKEIGELDPKDYFKDLEPQK
jgi:hypothetical protein